MYGDMMHMCTTAKSSNKVLDSLMSPHALERHMAIKNEKSSFFIQNMETCHLSSGITLNNGNEGSM